MSSRVISNSWVQSDLIYQPLEQPGSQVCITDLAEVRLFFLLLCVVFSCMYVCAACVCLEPTEAREDIRSLESGVIASWELPCGCWKPNLGPLEEHRMLFTSGPSLQTLREACEWISFLICFSCVVATGSVLSKLI